MASTNSDRPRGFIPVNKDGHYGGQVRSFEVDTTAASIFVGDPVTLEADGKVAPAGTAVEILGVVSGVHVDRSIAATEHPGYLPNGSSGKVMVTIAHPNQYFLVQEDGKLAKTDIGATVVGLDGGGSTTTGRSGFELDSSKASTGTDHQWMLVSLDDAPDNTTGTNADWIVVCNRPQITPKSGGI